MTDYETVQKRIYAAWLGKLIGIRLGAPIESWTCDEIRRTYGSISGYVNDYGQFAADDDANGPLFFSGVMRDHSLRDVSAADMGRQLLNVVGERRGFFWWGGIGVSTEQTAWENLNRGIPAPRSGSIAQNGKALAEQIGGQIFSDCWGYLSLGNAEEAVHLAERMSSVTHDGEGIEGGRFVAACIALAWTRRDIVTIVKEASHYLRKNSGYHALVQELLHMYETSPDHPEACLRMIQSRYGYDKYPGVCHILPNAAILLYGLLYGGNRFNRSMQLIAEAGCDTDCNLGNAGSILGMMLGLEGIESRWILPFHDILLCSSACGSRNITTISRTAEEMAAIACRLHGISCPAIPAGISRTSFRQPYSTGGFFLSADRYRQASLAADAGELRVMIADVLAGQDLMLIKKTYFRPQDVYDNRYDPQFSAIAEPGDLFEFHVLPPVLTGITLIPFARGYDGRIVYGEGGRGRTVRMRIPQMTLPVLEIGMCLQCHVRIRRQTLRIRSFILKKSPVLDLRFHRLATEDWGTGYDGRQSFAIAGIVNYQGQAEIRRSGLFLGPESAVNFSGPDCRFGSLTMEMSVHKNTDAVVAWGWQGCRKWTGIRIRNEKISHVVRNNENFSENPIAEGGSVHLNGRCRLHIDAVYDKIRIENDKGETFEWQCRLKKKSGAAAIINLGKSGSMFYRFLLA